LKTEIKIVTMYKEPELKWFDIVFNVPSWIGFVAAWSAIMSSAIILYREAEGAGSLEHLMICLKFRAEPLGKSLAILMGGMATGVLFQIARRISKP
jgi:hypothetical protein